MRIRKIDRKLEKDIIIGMITDKKYLSHIRPVMQLNYFKNSYSRTIAKWVMDYYDQYSEAPFAEIQKIYDYNERQGNLKDEDDVDLIQKLLQEAAEEYAECPHLNTDFLLTKTEEYFNRVNLEQIFAQASELMEQGEVNRAQELVFSATPIRIAGTQATDGLVDQTEMMEAFEEARQPLFKIPGDVGELLNSELCRDSFIALQAPPKGGKTWWLMWIALLALRARLKVVFFEFEMTKGQFNRRMSISISGKSDIKKYCGKQNYPKHFAPDAPHLPGLPSGVGVQYEEVDLGESLGWQEALKANEEFYKRRRLKKDKHWRLITQPARSMNVKQMDAELDRLAKEEDFVADVVLFDYIDILAAENSKEQERERIFSNWVAAKAMANRRHILLGTVTQSNAQIYDMEVQSKRAFAEDHRKYAQTNGTLGLTQTPRDKKNGIAKLNWLVLREGEWGEQDVCYILMNLKKGKFCVDSFIPSEFERRHGVKLGKVKPLEQPEQKQTIKKETANKNSMRSTRSR